MPRLEDVCLLCAGRGTDGSVGWMMGYATGTGQKATYIQVPDEALIQNVGQELGQMVLYFRDFGCKSLVHPLLHPRQCSLG